jgi:phosphohistidine phosphatase SixA
MTAHKLLPGRAIALEASLDQLGILLQSLSAPFSSNLLRHNPLMELLGLTLNGTKNAPEKFPLRG